MIWQSIKNSEKLKNIFLALFIASTFVALFLMWIGPVVGNVFSTINASLSGGPSSPAPANYSNNTGYLMIMDNTALIGSIVTSVTSLIGFITTTVITWRKEKRESFLADMERKKLETELERSRFELERLKKSRLKKKTRK